MPTVDSPSFAASRRVATSVRFRSWEGYFIFGSQFSATTDRCNLISWHSALQPVRRRHQPAVPSGGKEGVALPAGIGRTVSTCVIDSRTTLCATLPNTSRVKPLRP